jgi:hypothetical protein
MSQGRPFLVRSVTVTVDGVTYQGTCIILFNSRCCMFDLRSEPKQRSSDCHHRKQLQCCCSRSWYARPNARPHLNAVSKGYNLVDLAGERTHIPRRWQFARRVAGGIASCWSCAGFR